MLDYCAGLLNMQVAHSGILAIQENSRLFRRRALRLYVNEKDGDCLNPQPDYVHNVVLPAQVRETDRVHECIKGR